MSGPTHATAGVTLSEQHSKELLSSFGVPFPAEHVVNNALAARNAADTLGYPVVAKLNGDKIAHKTERGLVRLGLSSADAVEAAAKDLFEAATPEDGDVTVLIAPMIRSNREFICGMSTDPQFGPTVLLGVGGILAEAIADVVLRMVPISAIDAAEMIAELKTQALLDEFRGEPAVDREKLGSVLLALSDAAVARPDIASIDLNPVLIHNGEPVAVDALVELKGGN